MKQNIKQMKKKILDGLKEKTIKRFLCASCGICGNISGYDKESLKGSTWVINGVKIVLCCFCEDELLIKLNKARGVKIKLGDGGEIEKKQRKR